MSIYLDFHLVQTVPPSCINRDDTGSPKTAIYGGVERARVSSQAWKHAMRGHFKDIFAEGDVGYRTKKITSLLANKIVEKSGMLPSEALKKAVTALKQQYKIKIDEKKQENAALFFISDKQLDAIAQLIIEDNNNKEDYHKALKDNPANDMVLFGRMVADDPSLNYDAAAQVAHSFSTHAVQTEYDYFTAVDDCQKEDNAGAGHLGTVEYNSATLYRYATLNISELQKNLGSDISDIVCGFARAFILSMPTGKQNTFANRTLPDLVYITIRDDQPVNLCGAFENPIAKSGHGYAEPSCRRLVEYANQMYDTFAEKPKYALGCGITEGLSSLAEVQTLRATIDKLGKYIGDIK